MADDLTTPVPDGTIFATRDASFGSGRVAQVQGVEQTSHFRTFQAALNLHDTTGYASGKAVGTPNTAGNTGWASGVYRLRRLMASTSMATDMPANIVAVFYSFDPAGPPTLSADDAAYALPASAVAITALAVPRGPSVVAPWFTVANPDVVWPVEDATGGVDIVNLGVTAYTTATIVPAFAAGEALFIKGLLEYLGPIG